MPKKRYKDTPEHEKEERRRIRKLLGNPTNWGGKRPGAGRPIVIKAVQGLLVSVSLNRIQMMSLKEMGEGDINKGIQKIIDQHV
jgi:hypothetical protein